ncbi:unnamed protein product [Rotaria sordida]|uniref:Uncharacterized protein n=1 Tax=Rotaria sordida TaxID=392033 RepID=A0A815JH87_9BILA|nr:unnamed protein product [Rotaria sordida]CAF1615274.1 unnamed protein product [Rotaria sordida]
MNIIQLAAALFETTDISALEKIHHKCFGDRKMDTAPGDYRAKMYLIEGMISILKGQCFDAVGKFHQAMACLPSEETATALVILMSDSIFHQALINELLSAVSVLVTSGLKSALAAPIHPPPSEFAAENYLTANIRINLVRKYERAILKRLTKDSLQSAFSYIDMCDAVHDPTCLVSNWTIAYEERSARSMIRSQLEEVDRQIVEDAVENICDQAHISISDTAQSYVKAWLDNQYDGAEQLARFIADRLTTRDHVLMRPLMHPLEQLGICVRENEDKFDAMKHSDNTCNWVPAVFLNKTGNGMRIYGGVNLQLKLTEGRVPINNLASQYNAANVFASQTNVSATGPRNRQEYHAMKQNLIVASATNNTGSSRGGASGSGSSSSGNSSGRGGSSSRGGNGRKPPYDTGSSTGKESNAKTTPTERQFPAYHAHGHEKRTGIGATPKLIDHMASRAQNNPETHPTEKSLYHWKTNMTKGDFTLLKEKVQTPKNANAGFQTMTLRIYQGRTADGKEIEIRTSNIDGKGERITTAFESTLHKDKDSS